MPGDGDLGEGDQVALLEPRSLLLGIARASRYTGVDNPRLWTTADVRAALEALGLQGRGPSVEELNGEGFPYSPYVLRRPELLTPAAMAASPVRPVAARARAAAGPAARRRARARAAQPGRDRPGGRGLRRGRARRRCAAARRHAVAPDTVAPTRPAEPQRRHRRPSTGRRARPDDGGIGGLFADAEPASRR